jgi:hypothetical protein
MPATEVESSDGNSKCASILILWPTTRARALLREVAAAKLHRRVLGLCDVYDRVCMRSHRREEGTLVALVTSARGAVWYGGLGRWRVWRGIQAGFGSGF